MKPGYKQTEVGVIPEEWEVNRLGDCATFRTGPFGTALHKSDYTHDGIPVVNPMHIVDGGIVPTRSMTITEQAARSLSEFRLKPGEIVMGRRGDMGRCAVVQSHEAGWLCGTGSVVIRPKEADARFLQRLLSSPSAIAAIEDASVGTTMVNLNHGTLATLRLQFPPLPEQRAIATALSDVDGLLGGLDRLIAKKRDLKQAAMQQLLTGQTRLPGFHGEWEVKTLGKLLQEIGDGATPSTAEPRNFGGGINWVVIDDIKDEIFTTATTLTERGLQSCAATLWQPGTLILSTGATIGEVGIARVPVATKQGICGLVVNLDEATPTFLKYWFVLTKSSLLSKAQGSTIKEVRAPTLIKFELRTPSVSEQTAIAEVLTEMDGELAVLEQRREKTRALKQAMMQELLTGRTRLV